MKEDILDHFQEYDDNVRIVVTKYFYFEQEARLYAARLNEEGIPSFVSNANTITAFPMDQQGIGLHIREEDKVRAIAIIKEMDNNKNRAVDEDFRDADLEDIAYQEKLNNLQMPAWVWIPIILLAMLYGLYRQFY